MVRGDSHECSPSECRSKAGCGYRSQKLRETMVVCEKEKKQLLLDLVVLRVGWCLWMVMSGLGGSLPSG